MSGNYFKVKTGRSINDRQAFGEIYLVNEDGTPWTPDNPALRNPGRGGYSTLCPPSPN